MKRIAIALLVLLILPAVAYSAQQIVNDLDGMGTVRSKINANFTEVYDVELLAWDSSTSYADGEMVYYDQAIWVALAATDVGVAPSEGAQWTAALDSVGVDEVYSSGWAADPKSPEKDDIYDYLHQLDTDDDGDLTDESWWTAILDAKVNDTGNETIAGVKTFSSAPIFGEGFEISGTADGPQSLYFLEDTSFGTNYVGLGAGVTDIGTSYVVLIPVAVPAGEILSCATPGNQVFSDGVTRNASICTWIAAPSAPATADISDVTVTQTELEELATMGATTISDVQWAGLGAATTAGIDLIGDADAATQRTTLGVGTGDSPQLTAVNIGAAADTTIARSGAGDITVEGNQIYRAGGTDVPDGDVADNITITNISQVGDISASAAEINTIDDCATNEMFVGGGAGSAPVCTTAQGSGAPVRATSPTLTTPNIGAATATTPAEDDNDTSVATTAYVQTEISGLGGGATRDSLGLDTDDSPQFAGLNVGAASDTTIARSAAGILTVEGVTITRTIASGTTAVNPSSISDGACATVVQGTATGTATTDTINWTFNADPTSTTGYNPSGDLVYIVAYPTSNNVNFKVCNKSGSAVDPGSVSLNWKVTR